MKIQIKNALKTILSCSVIIILGALSLVLAFLCLDALNLSYLTNRATLIRVLTTVAVGLLTIVAIICQLADKQFVYKTTLLVLACAAIILAVVYVLKISGVLEKIDGIDSLRELVSSYGAFAVPIFILLQFLQVVVLPIPGFITITVGVALFGPFCAFLYSSIGIISASVVAFFIGRFFGYKAARWLVGKESLEKGLKLVKGKDTAVLTFMFLFPFFPDDILCFVAGLSTMKTGYYLVMVTATRLINIFVTSYSLNGSLIPYDSWQGIVAWILIFIAIAALCAFVYKKGEKIEKFAREKFRSKKDKKREEKYNEKQIK